ncbi:uncharacterized protein PgNI_01000 [Pyricularia grisea]|uniref:Uncharacterized protein n=1 Tax=Pyricularia grisea TaxID=148305 RepID=A0A6P8BH59_PYRGI|nr:uncharacterized protein PgNI_01000 [Pyricularia grisea]TLD16113.1 hypothetical protein PgNI_01000 [Pyricularia grisea]
MSSARAPCMISADVLFFFFLSLLSFSTFLIHGRSRLVSFCQIVVLASSRLIRTNVGSLLVKFNPDPATLNRF